MTLPTDAALLALLEEQYRRLDQLAARLDHARNTLIPPPANFWIGHARLAYDSLIDGMSGTVLAGVAALTSARDRTGRAIAEVNSRVG